jgi:hypothetical protein
LISEKPCAYDPRVGTNRRKPELAAQFAASAERRQAEREAKRIVGIWNARKAGNRALWFYPTIGAAILAGYPVLSFYCPACQQIGEVDLRNLDRHRGATIESLIPALSCRRCCPNPPFAKLLGLSDLPVY